MSERIYGYCVACGNYVYRIPNFRHGDGQKDTEGNPIWLMETTEFMTEEQIAEADANEVNCGCNE